MIWHILIMYQRLFTKREKKKRREEEKKNDMIYILDGKNNNSNLNWNAMKKKIGFFVISTFDIVVILQYW